MNYFVQKENTIEKYDVTYSKEDLFALKIEIIENCSEKIHRKYVDTKGPNQSDDLRIRNLHKERINDSINEEYLFIYDEYFFPEIVNQIDKLLNDNLSVLPDIFEKNIELKDIDFDKSIAESEYLLGEVDPKDFIKIQIINENIKLLKEEKIEFEKIRKLFNYYKKLRILINLKLVEFKTINSMNDMYECIETHNENKQRVL